MFCPDDTAHGDVGADPRLVSAWGTVVGGTVLDGLCVTASLRQRQVPGRGGGGAGGASFS